MTRGSWCTVLCCLAHREEGFVRLDKTPFTFVHTGGMSECGTVPEFTPDEVLVPEGEGGPGWALPSLWQLERAAKGYDTSDCLRGGCGHNKPAHGPRAPRPCREPGCRCPGWTDEPGAAMPPAPPVQGDLFTQDGEAA